MKTQWNKHKIFLVVGLIFIFGGILLLVFFSSALSLRMYIFRPLLLLTLGAITLYQTLIGKRRALFIFSGLFLSCIGLLFLLVDAKILPYTLLQIWPVMVILSGILFIPIGYFCHNRLQASYIVPGFALVGFGIVFILFSLDIITMPFSEFARYWWPLVFILFGILLIALFIYTQKNNKTFLFGDSDEDEDLL